MQMTLLEMVQNILSSMDSDNVNDVEDTDESQQVALIIKETYYEKIVDRQYAFLKRIFQLEGVGNTDQPNKLKLPLACYRIDDFKYNTKQEVTDSNQFQTLIYKEPTEFLEIVHSRETTADNVQTVLTDSSVPIYIYNDQAPTYWTSFDDTYVWTDSYDSDLESTLQQSKTSVLGIKEPTWTVSNTFIPDLPANMFTLLLNEAKATCHLNLKQQANPKAEQIARRQYLRLRDFEIRAAGGKRYVNYSHKFSR